MREVLRFISGAVSGVIAQLQTRSVDSFLISTFLAFPALGRKFSGVIRVALM